MPSTHRGSTTRTVAVLFQIIVFVSTIFGPVTAFAEEPPAPEATAVESTQPATEPIAEQPPVVAEAITATELAPPTAEPSPETDAAAPSEVVTDDPSAVAGDEPTNESAAQAPDEGSVEPATEATAPGSQPPAVWTSKDDYVPAELVDIHGAGWLPGETVDLFVNDDEGKTWNHRAAIVADEFGAFYYEFRLPEHFVATYTVTATGDQGSSAQWVFADSIAQGDIVSNTNGGTSELTLNLPAIAAGEVAIAQIVVNKDLGSGNICAPSGWTSILRTNRGSPAVYVQETFRRTTAAAAGSHTWQFRTGSCPSGGSATAKGAAGGAAIYTGVDTANPIRAMQGQNNGSTTSATLLAPTTPPVTGDLILRFVGLEKHTSVTPTATTTATELWEQGSSGSPSQRTAAAYSQAANSSTYPNFVVNFGTSGEWTAQTIVLRMAAAAVNTPPTISNIADQTINEDTNTGAVSFTVGDAQTAPGSLTVSGTSSDTALVPNANIVFGGSGANRTVTVTPAANQFGSATITVTVSDGSLSSSDTFLLTVRSVNDAPSFTKGADQAVNEDSGPHTVNGWATAMSKGPANESGQTLAFVVTDNTNPGLFTIAPSVSDTGTLSYSLAANLNGTATISLKLTDSAGTENGGVDESAVQTFLISVAPVNDAPVCADAGTTLLEDAAALASSVSCSDIDSASLTYELDSSATKGALTFNTDGTFSYDSDPDANGTDSFTFHATDGSLSSGVATFTINITPVNDAPSFTKGADQTVNEDSGPHSVSNWATNIAAGPTNESAQNVTFVITNNTNPGLFSAGPAVSSTGTLSYSLAADANGGATISLKLTDDGGTANGGVDESAVQTFTISVTAVNDAPSFTKGDDQTVNEDSGPHSVSNWAMSISAGPADETEQSVTFVVTDNSNAALFSAAPSVSADGTLSYTLAADANGSATISLKLTDDGGTANGGVNESAVQSFTITVLALNDAPIANTDDATTAEDTAVSIDAVANDNPGPATATDEAGQTLSVQASSISDPDHGTAVLVTTGPNAGEIEYTPDPNYNGPDSFAYVVCDDGTSQALDTNGELTTGPDARCSVASATVSVTVTEVNDPPRITAFSVTPTTIAEGGSVTAQLDFSDVDEGQSYTCTFAWGTGEGSTTVAVQAGAGTCSASHTYADDNPTATLSDSYTVSGTVTDNGTTNGAADPLSDTSTQAITVNNVAPVVTITDPAAGSTVPVGTSIAVRATYTDAGTQDAHTCTINGSPGIVTPDPEVDGAGTCTGSVTAAPGANTITVVVTDDDLGQGTASVSVSGLYAIYAHERCSGGAGKGIIVNGERADIDGAIHSNGMFTINGSYFQSSGASIYRAATNACKAVYSSTASFGPPTPTAPTKETSARTWPVSFARSDFACTFTGAEFVFNRSAQVIPSGVYCASKSFKINASNVMGDITVIAPEIVINGKSISLKPYARGVLLLGTSTKEIVIDSDFSADTTASLSGLIHNPAGGIKVNGQAVRLQHGFLQGLWVEVNLTGFSMTYPAR